MASVEQRCAMCKEPGKACAGCRNIRYCSRQCQDADWGCHRLICTTFLDFSDANRPSSTARRALLFPKSKEMPTFIWVNVSREGLGHGIHSDLWNILGSAVVGCRITHNATLNRILQHTIVLNTGDSKDSDVNRSILRNINGRHVVRLFKGDFVAFCENDQSLDQLGDLDATDFKIVMDYFANYGQDDRIVSAPPSETVRGVCINCPGAQDHMSVPHFQTIDLSCTHPLFDKGHRSQIAAKIGIPLSAVKLEQHYSWADDPDKTNNQPATFLHLQTRSGSNPSDPIDACGSAPTYWQNSVGSVLVARRDKKDLSLRDIEALCHWCQYGLQDLFRRHDGDCSEEEQISEDEVNAAITMEAFEAYADEHFPMGLVEEV